MNYERVKNCWNKEFQLNKMKTAKKNSEYISIYQYLLSIQKNIKFSICKRPFY